MPSRLLLLQGCEDATRTASARAVAQAARTVEPALQACVGLTDALERLRQTPAPGVVLLDPDVGRPLPASRTLAQANPDLRFVYAIEREREALLRREAMLGAPPGGRWAMVPADAPSLPQVLREQLAAERQMRRLRTTLDRMKVKLSRPDALDPAEYRRLIVSDRYLASVLAHARDAIVSVDTSGRIVSWNGGAERLFSLAARDALGRSLVDLFEARETVAGMLAQALDRRPIGGELKLAVGGGVRHVEAHIDPMVDDGGHAIGAVVLLHDVTERQAAAESLRESARQKDQYLAMLAHELRNPLAPIRNAAQLLAMREDDDPALQDAVGVILRQVGHMTGLIDDLLDVARVTRGAVSLRQEALPVASVVGDAIEQARTLIERRGHTLTVAHADPLLRVRGDRKRLTQVMSNLLVNAAKYTPPGGRIGVETRAEAQEAVIAVSDSGIGIEAALLPRVFEPFVQAQRGPDRAEGGLGIGLALVRSLTLAHGGRVRAHSDGPGRGSRFEVRLPRLPDANVEHAAPVPIERPAHAPRALDVLVVDDNPDAAHTLGMLLRTLGHRATVETDPVAALRRAEAAMPDALVLDIGMPGLDGYELARRLRRLRTSRPPALIALTGYGQPGDHRRAREAGFDRLMVKPPDAGALLEALDTLAPRHGPERAAGQAG